MECECSGGEEVAGERWAEGFGVVMGSLVGRGVREVDGMLTWPSGKEWRNAVGRGRVAMGKVRLKSRLAAI